MLKNQFCFKFLIFSLAITFYQTEAIGPNCQTGLECQIFQSPGADVVKFCRAELEKSFATSSEHMISSVFVSEKEKTEILAQVQSEVLANAPDREARVEQLVKAKTAELASRNYTAILNEFLMSSRKCAQSATSANQTTEPQQASVKHKPVISNQVLDDLRVLSGNKQSGLFNVAQRLFGKNGMAPVSTPAGFAAATYALTNPETNKEKLEKRRKTLLKLINKPELVAKLRLQLNDYAKARSNSFDRMLSPVLPEPFDAKKHGSLYNYQVSVASKIVNLVQYQSFDTKEKGGSLWTTLAIDFLQDINGFLYRKLSPPLCLYLPLTQASFYSINKTALFSISLVFTLLAAKIKYDLYANLKSEDIKLNISDTFKDCLLRFIKTSESSSTFLNIFLFLLLLKKSISDLPINKNQLSAVGQLLTILDNLQNMVKYGKSCEQLFYGQSTVINKSLENSAFDFNKKIKQLESRKDHKLTYLPKYRHEQTISLFQEFFKNLSVDPNGKVVIPDSKVLLDCFTPMHEKVGEIDLLVSLAELIINSKDQKAVFTVAQFIHDSDRAIVRGDDVWNVLIDRNKVVPNDVLIGSFGEKQEKSVQGIMVTGGNGSGKSVHIVAVSTAAWLAQCLGIAPAKEFAITQFDNFVTQINTVDDPLNNKSLFRAQIRQFGQIVTEVTNETEGGKKLTFVCLDESLSGTKPKYAGPLLAALIKGRLSTSNNFAMLFATHLENLACKVENLSDGTMVPVQVACNLNKDGHFESSTYKIAPGASDVDSAFKVAQEEWIDFMPEKEVESLLEIAKAEFGKV